MKTFKLRTKILLGILAMIVFWGLVMSAYGFFILQKYIIGEAQEKIEQEMKTVRSVYDAKLNEMRVAFKFIEQNDNLSSIQQELGLDYLKIIIPEELSQVGSEIVKRTFESGNAIAGTRIIQEEELSKVKPGLVIEIKPTPKAHPTARTKLTSAMTLEYARPFLNNQGKVDKVLYGGKIINQNHALVDEIAEVVFKNGLYHYKPLGTVTVFQDDVRVATNVLDQHGQRAVGTRVSDEVYRKVVEHGQRWVDRAFVVTDWYITAYEPIRDIQNNVIGILYVGILEKPFWAIREQLFAGLIMIILIGGIPTIVFSFLLTRSLARPLTEMIQKITKISHGELEHKIKTPSDLEEIQQLTAAFNDMSQKLVEREKSLAVSNEKLAVMNKRYLDLIGFVSHELKGILSSIVLNTYLLRKKILGEINEKQDKVLRSMARNLDYLTVTVKNFLNLSRIEKDELKIEKKELLLKAHIFDPALDSFIHQAEEKKLNVEVNIKEDLKINADPGLMQIVVNNLLSNAIKYGLQGGNIRINAKEHDGMVEVEVYNDGEPIASVDISKLFKKFSRIVYQGMEAVKGTGIGLFISKEIIEKHGGKIWVEPALKGNAFKFLLNAHEIS
ncbi:MAG: cache domain-containing protein [Candidatus Omnitrophota bacterium]